MARTKQPVVGPRCEGSGEAGAVQAGRQDSVPESATAEPSAGAPASGGPFGVVFYRPSAYAAQAGGSSVPVFRPQPALGQPSSKRPLEGPSTVQLPFPQSVPSTSAAAFARSMDGGSSGETTMTESEASDHMEAGAVIDPTDPEWGSRKRQRTSSRPSSRLPVNLAPGIAGERKANRMWRQHLNMDLMKIVLQNVKRKMGHSKTFPFLTQVDLDVAPDYHHFVKPEDEMWLHQISNKTRALAYSDRTQLLSDIEAIRGNCLAYNTPGCGQYGGPALVDWAHELVAVARQEVEAMADSLTKAEDALKDPECAPPYREPVAERAITTRVVNQVPLPAGFKHTVRVTSSKPGGWVQYEAECPVHRCIKSADRVAKLVDIFKGHANCREEWRQFAQRPEEPFNQYTDRLRETFNFAKGPPPNTASISVNLLASSQFGGQPSQARAATAAAAFRPLPDAAAGASRAASPALNAAAPWTTRAPLPAVAAPLRPPVQGGGPEPEPSYKTAFRQVTAPHKPAFDPPPAPVLWPRRQSPPSGSPSQPGNAEPAEAAAASRPTAGDSFTANADDRAVQRSRSDGPPAVDAAAIAANARQQLQLEADRYRHEQAERPANGPSTSGTGLVDQSWGRRSEVFSSSSEEREQEQQGLPNGHALGASGIGGSQANGYPITVAAAAAATGAGAEEEEPPEWDGAGSFPRPLELRYLRNKLSAASPGRVLLLTGPPASGKSALLAQTRDWWKGEERQRAADGKQQGWAPWLQWDCHTACADGSHFAMNLKAAVAEFAYNLKQERAVDLPLIRLRDHLSYIKPEEWIPSKSGPESLSETLSSLGAWWPQLSREGRPLACLVLDAAHKLKEAPCARQVLDSLEQFARQGVHVILATSDCTFRSWLADGGVEVNVETIGNLPQGAARAFLAGLLKRQPAPVDLAKDWPEIYMVCGGNLGLLKHCLQGAASYQSLDPALRSIWSEAGAKVRQGLDARSREQGSDIRHTKEQYSAAVGAIVASSSRAVSATELENQLQPNGAAVIRSLASSGLLMLREASGLAKDIPAAAYGPLQDRVVTLPSAAHAYFWSLLSKASADAIGHGVP